MNFRFTTLCIAASLLFSLSSMANDQNDSQFINLLSLLRRQGTLGAAELYNLAAQNQNDLYGNGVENPFTAQRRAQDRRVDAAANMIDGTIVALQPNPSVVAAWAQNLLRATAQLPRIEINFAEDEPAHGGAGNRFIWLQGPPAHAPLRFNPIIDDGVDALLARRPMIALPAVVIEILAQRVGQDFSNFLPR